MGKVGVFIMSYIFDEIQESDNESLSLLNKKDLYYLLDLINNYKLLLRDKINVGEYNTFGLEIECEQANWNKIVRRMIPEWELTDDLSLLEGAEIKSPPLRDTKDAWINLRKMCCVLQKYSNVGINSGGHIHVGTQALGSDTKYLINFMKLWSVYEHVYI